MAFREEKKGRKQNLIGYQDREKRKEVYSLILLHILFVVHISNI